MFSLLLTAIVTPLQPFTQRLGLGSLCVFSFFLHHVSSLLESKYALVRSVQEVTLVHTGAHSLQLLCTIRLQSEREGTFQSLAPNRVPSLQKIYSEASDFSFSCPLTSSNPQDTLMYRSRLEGSFCLMCQGQETDEVLSESIAYCPSSLSLLTSLHKAGTSKCRQSFKHTEPGCQNSIQSTVNSHVKASSYLQEHCSDSFPRRAFSQTIHGITPGKVPFVKLCLVGFSLSLVSLFFTFIPKNRGRKTNK